MKKELVSILLYVLLMFSACVKAPEENKPFEDDKLKEENKILVVYFSATSTTKDIANKIKEITNANIHEITPKEPYTADDLKYYTDCRADREQSDKSFRTEITNNLTSIDEYNTIYLGYPIWHGYAPRIIFTFLESFDFSDKNVIIFATSGSSSINSSVNEINNTINNINIIESKRIVKNESIDNLKNWIENIK